jgi:catechol 2,3-dioxygenase-like lactoylglutathione lyase family enzyme
MTQEIAARTGATKPQRRSKSSPDLALLSGKSLKLTTSQPARHPSPITKATALAYVIFERPDLDKAAKYLTDFGLRIVSRDDQRLLLRGTGPARYCYIVERASKPRFVGLGLTVDSDDALARLAKLPDASGIESVSLPGGGRRVRLTDPAGLRVDAIAGRTSVESLPHRAPIMLNAPDNIIRVDRGQRPPQKAPDVTKLGHLLLEVPNYQEVSARYTGTFGFIPSDVAVLPNGEPVATFFRSQIFDYWTDPWGDKHEHHCDGDVFTAAVPTEVPAMSRQAMAQWGRWCPGTSPSPSSGCRSSSPLCATCGVMTISRSGRSSRCSNSSPERSRIIDSFCGAGHGRQHHSIQTRRRGRLGRA